MPAICRQRFAVRAKKSVEKNFFEKNIWSVRRKIVPLHPQRGQRDACSMHDSVAQLVEQLTLNQRVEGSSPSGVTLIEGDYSTTPYALDVILFLCPVWAKKIRNSSEKPVKIRMIHSDVFGSI